ncbi:hypothetical protein V2J09_000290 [Rumex salicifolius]
MEQPEEVSRGSDATTKRKRKSWKIHRRPAGFLFPLALAALNHHQHPSSAPLIKMCLNEFNRLLSPNSPDSLSFLPDDHLLDSILALLPLIFKSRCSDIVRIGLKILGAAALISYEVNEKIALKEDETLRLLLPKVLCGSEKVAKAACNALLDVMKSSTSLASLCIFEKEGVLCLRVQQMEDELLMLLLTASTSLIKCCGMEQLGRIPRKLIDRSIICLKNIWAHLHGQILCRKIWHGSNSHVSGLTTHSMAETIFRLSLNATHSASGVTFDAIMRHIIGADKSSYQNFMINHWELSPFITRRSHMDLHQSDNLFDGFAESVQADGSFPSFLSSMLQGMVSCAPLALDEADIFRYLNEVEAFASPIVYQQDIRVVRTEPNLKREEHFFAVSANNCTVKLPSAFTMDDIFRCEEAYKEGYTIALRGMEFRLKNIAYIADKVASLFGQPSVGANLYLTPPNAQGLACHYDDHCVFVCQLRGTKLWTVFSHPLVELPRLYDCLEDPPDSVEGNREILLREGDVLYIPRGFPHKAFTFTARDEDSAGAAFSMHLTIAIEIEPPFEWEGFIHVALLHWSYCTKLSDDSRTFLSEDFGAFLISLLHIAIKLISNSESSFRKACLVAASSLPSDIGDWLDQNQRYIFDQLINKINQLSSFSDALNYVKASVQSSEDPFHSLRWLHSLDAEELVRCGFDLPLKDIEKITRLIDQHKPNSEAKFVHAKARFCQEIVFDDVKERFKMMHAMFKKVRRQYMNGMLSLHY